MAGFGKRLGPITGGVVCTVVEPSVPRGFGSPSFAPSGTVTIVPNGTVTVVVTNPLLPPIPVTGSQTLMPVGIAAVLIGAGMVLVAYGPLRRRTNSAD